jgi:hypothetical protein
VPAGAWRYKGGTRRAEAGVMLLDERRAPLDCLHVRTELVLCKMQKRFFGPAVQQWSVRYCDFGI